MFFDPVHRPMMSHPSSAARRSILRAGLSIAALTPCGPLAACATAPRAVAGQGEPFYRATGDHPRSYVLTETGETSPYRIYVPARWKPGSKAGMVVILHGGSGTQDGPFDGEPADLKGVLKAQADKHGFIILSPYGYLGQWGSDLPLPPPPAGVAPPGSNLPPAATGGRTRPSSTDRSPAAERIRALGVIDVLNVVERTIAEYGVDRSRVFLMGNSGGAIGTMFLAQKHPELWAAIAPSNAPVEASSFPFDRLAKGRLSGAFVVHGQQDRLTSGDLMREQADRIQAVGVETRYIDVEGGTHGSAFYKVLPDIFDFFAAHPARRR